MVTSYAREVQSYPAPTTFLGETHRDKRRKTGLPSKIRPIGEKRDRLKTREEPQSLVTRGTRERLLEAYRKKNGYTTTTLI